MSLPSHHGAYLPPSARGHTAGVGGFCRIQQNTDQSHHKSRRPPSPEALLTASCSQIPPNCSPSGLLRETSFYTQPLQRRCRVHSSLALVHTSISGQDAAEKLKQPEDEHNLPKPHPRGASEQGSSGVADLSGTRASLLHWSLSRRPSRAKCFILGVLLTAAGERREAPCHCPHRTRYGPAGGHGPPHAITASTWLRSVPADRIHPDTRLPGPRLCPDTEPGSEGRTPPSPLALGSGVSKLTNTNSTFQAGSN